MTLKLDKKRENDLNETIKEEDFIDDHAVYDAVPRSQCSKKYSTKNHERKEYKKRSICWNFFRQISADSVKCSLCGILFNFKSGSGTSTSNLLGHIRKKHTAEYKAETSRKQKSSV